MSKIKLDFARPYSQESNNKIPVLLLLHGFLGLNSFDALLTSIPEEKYIGVGMHFGTIPNKLPVDDYSSHVLKNIDKVICFFGESGHAVYILDHSIANTYFLMMDREYKNLEGVQKYLKGRIGINPFFCEEAKHGALGFINHVINPSLKFSENFFLKSFLTLSKKAIHIDSKKGVRSKGIFITKILISGNLKMVEMIWKAFQKQTLIILNNLDSVPPINREPILKALSRLNSKIFGIQLYSALQEYKHFDGQLTLSNFKEKKLPILILKSKKDAIAKYVPRFYDEKFIEVVDVTNHIVSNLFEEHLYFMKQLEKTVGYIDNFVDRIENKQNYQ